VLRDTDIFKGELLEVGKVNPFHQAIWELAFAEGSNAEGAREPESRCRWGCRCKLPKIPIYPIIPKIKFLEVVERRRAKPGVDCGGSIGEVVRRMQKRRPGPEWVERMSETVLVRALSSAARTFSSVLRSIGVTSSEPSRTRGAARQEWRHREDRIWVRAPSFMDKREIMSPRIASGRLLM